MKIVLVSRYPQADTPAWKRHLAERLRAEGHELAVLFSRSSMRDIATAGFAEYGLDALRRFISRSPGDPGVGRSAAEPRTLDAWAKCHGVCRHHGVRLDEATTLDWTRAHAPDLLVLVGADIVPQALLEIPRLGSLNPHYGLLPRYRGMNVTEWSIYHDDPVGVSVHAVDPGIDTGPIHMRRSIPVEHGATLESIRAEQRSLSARLLGDTVAALARGTAEPVAQSPDQGRQFYRMHPLLLDRVRLHLSRGYRWLGVPDPPATVIE
jgi:folate-dependent phosphoribosylglycinamide formyltransferase PurN